MKKLRCNITFQKAAEPTEKLSQHSSQFLDQKSVVH